MPLHECLCGHSEKDHKDHRDEWTACLADGCGCLAFTRPRVDDTIEPDRDDEMFFEGCPDCGQDTVVEDADCCVRCTSCGWRE